MRPECRGADVECGRGPAAAIDSTVLFKQYTVWLMWRMSNTPCKPCSIRSADHAPYLSWMKRVGVGGFGSACRTAPSFDSVVRPVTRSPATMALPCHCRALLSIAKPPVMRY